MKRHHILTLLIGMALLSSGCEKNEKNGSPEKAAAPAADKGPARAKVTVPQAQFLKIEPAGASGSTDTLSLPGRVTFRTQANSAVGATAAGRVVSVLVQAGQIIKAGAPLFVIESADAAAARSTLDQTATRVSTADNAYKRQVQMVEKGVGLEFEKQEAEARLKEARAEHERARQAVNLIGGGHGIRVTVSAPANGVVMNVRAAVGATVAPGGEPLVELGDPTRLQAVAQVPENELRRIAVGQEAEVELPALNTRAAARVESFSPRVEVDSRRAPVYFALSGNTEGLRPGMLAQINVRVAGEKGLSLPVSAVLIKDGKRRIVYVAKPDGTYEARDVEVGRNRDGRVTILKGLSAGENVVVQGGLLLDTQAEQML